MSLATVMEIIGTITFAISGSMEAVKKDMDIFGVICMGVVTAMGGGLMRDVIMGSTIPAMFRSPVNISLGIGASLLTFLFFVIYYRGHVLDGLNVNKERNQLVFDHTLNLLDAIGLGIFTVIGVNAAIAAGNRANTDYIIFFGMLTGVGGGLLRDVMAGQIPIIFKKNIYAVASLIGAGIYVALIRLRFEELAMIIAPMVIILIRVLAHIFDWNLPRVGKRD